MKILIFIAFGIIPYITVFSQNWYAPKNSPYNKERINDLFF